MTDYFKAKADSNGVSGDDVNRRYREARLGFAAPSEDWDQAGVIVHCIYPGQIPTKSHACIVLWDMSSVGPIGFVAESLEDILSDPDIPKLDDVSRAPSAELVAHLANEDGDQCRFGLGAACERDRDCDDCMTDQVAADPRDYCDHRDDDCSVVCSGCVFESDMDDKAQLASIEPDDYEKAFTPDPEGCGCHRDDCHDCNIDLDKQTCLNCLHSECPAFDQPCEDCHMPTSAWEPKVDGPPSLTPATVETLTLVNDPVDEFKEMQANIDVAVGRLENAQYTWVCNHIMCKHFVVGTCHQVDDACFFKTCPRLNFDGLEY